MKFCSTCQEEFADKFSFCPVDGTPLTAVARAEEPSITAMPGNGGAVLLNSEPEPAFAGGRSLRRSCSSERSGAAWRIPSDDHGRCRAREPARSVN